MDPHFMETAMLGHINSSRKRLDVCHRLLRYPLLYPPIRLGLTEGRFRVATYANYVVDELVTAALSEGRSCGSFQKSAPSNMDPKDRRIHHMRTHPPISETLMFSFQGSGIEVVVLHF